MNVLILAIGALFKLLFGSFIISWLWGQFLIPKFGLPKLDTSEVAWLILIGDFTVHTVCSISSALSQFSAAVVSWL
jgi:hypothetical protein